MRIGVHCLLAAAGGAVGAAMRYLIGLLPLRMESGFPIGTLLINIVGAFCLGWITAFAGKHTGFNPQLQLFLTVGVCGGFTTFSTFCKESYQLFQDGRLLAGGLYIFLSIALGLAAVFAAQFSAR